jgi:hypothetical protein
MAGTPAWPRAGDAWHVSYRRRAAIGVAVSVLLLVSGCVQAEPGSIQPSASPSPGETAAGSTFPTIEPTPSASSAFGAADVLIAVDDVTIAYPVRGCPVAVWLDAAIDDDIDFGIYPEYLTASDGTRWSTHMVVLQMVNGHVTDWSFVLTTPLSGKPGDAERRLMSSGDTDSRMTASFTDDRATFATAFWDSASADEMTPRPLPGSVTVTCS